jgi:arylsulfatase A-like enzyme
MKKMISILLVLAMAFALLAGCGESAAEPASTELGQSEKVVILVLDALSSNYLSQMGSNSNLAKIAKDGACNLNARCVYPSHTLTNHATIMTGVSSGAHSIIGNVRIGDDGISTIKNREPELLKAETIFEMAKAQGLKTAVVSGKNNLVTLFSRDCDVGTSNVRPLDYLPATVNLDDAETNEDYYKMNLELADWVFDSLYTVLEKESPDLTLVNIQSTDYIGHRFGPESDEMKTCLKRVDKALGKLYDKMKKSGMLENTTLIIVADHGMTESDKALNLNVLTMMKFPEAVAAIDGRTGYIWLNGTDEAEVISYFAEMEGVKAVFSGNGETAKEFCVASEDGPDLILETEAGYVFLPQPMIDEYHGQHGSADESDMVIPMIMVGSGIPAGAGIDATDLRSIAPLVCKLLGISGGNFEISEPALLPLQDLSAFKK